MPEHGHPEAHPNCACSNLCQAEVGTLLKIRKVNDDGPVGKRLREMGFCEAAEVKKISDNGTLLCSVCGAQMALSRELASQIHVDPVQEKKKNAQ